MYEAKSGFGFFTVFKGIFWATASWTAYNAYLYGWDNENAIYSKRTLCMTLVYNSYLYDFVQSAHGYAKIGTGYITDPPRDKVLPKEIFVPGIIPKRKLLVMHLDDMLVHKDVKLGEAPSIALRPGLKKFLGEMSQHYQLVVISDHHTEVINNDLVCHASDKLAGYIPETRHVCIRHRVHVFEKRKVRIGPQYHEKTSKRRSGCRSIERTYSWCSRSYNPDEQVRV